MGYFIYLILQEFSTILHGVIYLGTLEDFLLQQPDVIPLFDATLDELTTATTAAAVESRFLLTVTKNVTS